MLMLSTRAQAELFFTNLIFHVLVVPQSEAFSILPRQYHAFSDLFERWPFLLPGAPFVPIAGLRELNFVTLFFQKWSVNPCPDCDHC